MEENKGIYKKRIILTIEGEHYLIPEGKDLGALVDTVSSWQRVNESKGYGRPTQWIIKDLATPTIQVAIVDPRHVDDGQPKAAAEVVEVA